MNVCIAWPRLMRPDVATEYVGGRAVMDALLEQKLIKPKVKNARFTVYDRVALDLACDCFKSFEGGE